MYEKIVNERKSKVTYIPSTTNLMINSKTHNNLISLDFAKVY